jgi:NADH-quinone oxidoreductase subunit J
MDIFFFLVFAAIALISAVNVVLQRHPIASALSLIGVMGSIAVLYLLLGAEFIAMAQIVVYAGAVMVLFIFVIMLLNAGAEVRSGRSWTSHLLGVPALLAFVALIVYFVQRGFADAGTVKFGNFTGGSPQSVGYALFTEYLLPFEVTSVLILVAILGAIVLARKEMD